MVMFSAPIIDDGNVAFIGNAVYRPGIYVHDTDTGVQTRVVDFNTPIPGRPFNFMSFPTMDRRLTWTGT